LFALGIRYLNGFAAASEPDARDRPEWPPHPARVFMALVAAHFETGADSSERVALEWIETLSPPRLRAPAHMPREVVTHFVPVNDKPVWKKDPAKPKQKPPPPLQSAPGIMRVRQDRTFARAWVDDDIVYLSWPDTVPEPAVWGALEGLCRKVTRIGHSTSLVQMWTAGPEEIGESNWIPDNEHAELNLRVAEPGTLAELERRYNAAAADLYGSLTVAAEDAPDGKARRAARRRLQDEFGDEPPPRLRPHLSAYQGYAHPRAPAPVIPGSVFSPQLVAFTLESTNSPFRALGLLSVPALVARWREALLSQLNDMPGPLRSMLSGHATNGEPLESPHVAFIPLAFVGHQHADGHLLGMAIALPASVSTAERKDVLRVVGRVTELKLGPLGVWRVGRDFGPRSLWALRPEAWTAHPEGATHWATVTPVGFDRHPKARDRAAYQREAAGTVAGACEAVGLPRPREVILTAVSAHLGVPPAHAFPRLSRKDGSKRRHAHAILVFEEPVRGPLLIGAGRYRGYGVGRPIVGADLR
jgi:CRISPR-associated protein Csb2